MMPAVRIGTSGFSYPHWRGVFYPQHLPEKRWLEFYATEFDTVELNATFYRLPSEATVRNWAQRVPASFLFAAKLSRFITHLKRLHGVSESLAVYLTRLKLLGARFGPILVQLPPAMQLDIARLQEFLDQCDPAFRWAVEFRHPSWLVDATFDLLARHHTALCLHDMLPDHPHVITARFTYLRFHGTDQRYGGNYPDEHLRVWADRIHTWRTEGLVVFAYFNNDQHGYALQNARTLRALTTDDDEDTVIRPSF